MLRCFRTVWHHEFILCSRTGGTHVFWEGIGHSAGTKPTKCLGTMLSAGVDQLLWQVHPKPSGCPTPTSWTTMCQQTRKCQKAFEEETEADIGSSVGPLWPSTANPPSRWCISIYRFGAVICQMGRSVPLPMPLAHWQQASEIILKWKRRHYPSYSALRNSTNFLWETFHSYHGPQATHCHTGAKERCSHAVMGIVTVHL